jgi:hypothetical protein
VDETGLELSFRPDPEIFGALAFDGIALARWLTTTGVRFEKLDHRVEDVEKGGPEVLHFSGFRPA